MSEKRPFNAAPFREALRVYGCEMSDRAIEPYLKERIKAFLASPTTDAQVFDFCHELSQVQCDRYGKNKNGGAAICIGDIDAFGQALFDVSKFYERPTA